MRQIYMGSDSFRKLRENNYYYVDKTKFLKNFLEHDPAEVTLITRPRRFGKSLNMSMLAEFLDIQKKSAEIFQGLDIMREEEIRAKWMNKWPTLLLSFKEMREKDFSSAIAQFTEYVGMLFEKFSFLEESEKLSEVEKRKFHILRCGEGNRAQLGNSLLFLSDLLQKHFGKRIILLIDEYDVPINTANEEGYYEDMIAFIRNFLGAVLKGNEHLKFAVLTGCLRIAKESIFTGLNNFVCFGISNVRFSDAFGFTSAEVDAILADANLSEKKGLLKKWYDGYRFGKTEEIYCPWDVLQYVCDALEDPEARAQAYWKNSSENRIVKKFIREADQDAKEKIELLIAGKPICQKLMESMSYNSLYDKKDGIWTILYLTGYLTKAGSCGMGGSTEGGNPLPSINESAPLQTETENDDKKNTADSLNFFNPGDTAPFEWGDDEEERGVLLRIPNREVKTIFSEDISSWFREKMAKTELSSLTQAFWDGDAEAIQDLLIGILYESISVYDSAESYYHGFMIGLLEGAGMSPKSNIEQGLGRPDILVVDMPHKRALIIELKRSAAQTELDGKAEEALKQIESRSYAKGVPSNIKNVLCYGIAFWKKECVVKCENRNSRS